MFAQRVIISDLRTVETTSNFNVAKNRELQYEINKNKLDIDRSCFAKTQKEKNDLKLAKMLFKQSN